MPLIGITPDVRTAVVSPSDSKAESVIFLQERTTRAILDAGGIPLVLPITSSRTTIREILERLDGILVSGGNFDIHPKLYGEQSIEALGEVKEERTQFELELISLALDRNQPILGVCGGQQAINVALGGSLYQDIATQIPNAIDHQQGTVKEQGGHQIKIHDGTKLTQVLGQDTLTVNSTHHQAVKTLGRGLIVNAKAEDGIIEGVESQNHSFVLGVQWHPEFLIEKDLLHRKIFASLISACRASPLPL